MRTTKIVATLGPASDAPDVLRKLFEAGVDVFRLNASHGDQEAHGRRIQAVRQLSAELGVHAGILLDLQGPKIRLGTFENGGCTLEAGRRFTISTEPAQGNCDRGSTNYSEFARDVKPGDPVLLNDGAVRLRVLRTDGVEALCEVVAGGPVSDRKGINLPGVTLSLPSMTKKDIADARFGIEAGVDFMAMSFVRRRDDVLRLKVYLDEAEKRIPVVAKIEKPEGWHNLQEILEESDGVMVARGDLGVEMPLEKVPYIQKQIIERARKGGKFVITATQMLESMIEHAVPTRAEVSDVANAVYDGTDAVMLSAETSAGKFPVEAATMMARIALEIQNEERPFGREGMLGRERPTNDQIMADATYRAAHVAGVDAIVVLTGSGTTARLVASYRPAVPIYAFTPEESVARQLAVIFGVRPLVAPDLGPTEEMLRRIDDELTRRALLREGDRVVFVAGQPTGRPGSTNLMKLHRIGELR